MYHLSFPPIYLLEPVVVQSETDRNMKAGSDCDDGHVKKKKSIQGGALVFGIAANMPLSNLYLPIEVFFFNDKEKGKYMRG